MQPSARGAAAGCCGSLLEPQIQHSRFKIRWVSVRAAACEGHARADLRTRGAGLRGAKLRPAAASLKPQIQHSKFKIQNYEFGPQPAEVAARCTHSGANSKLDGLPGMLGHTLRFGAQPAEGTLEADLRDASCGPPPPPGCGPHGPIGPKQLSCGRGESSEAAARTVLSDRNSTAARQSLHD